MVVEAWGVFGEGALALVQSLAIQGGMGDEAAAIVESNGGAVPVKLPMVSGRGWMVALLVLHKGIYIQWENDHT